MCFTPCTVASELSILRATSVSSCAGEAPGSIAITVTVGSSMSGKSWTRIARKAIAPPSVRMMKSRMAGVGLRIDQDETLMVIGASAGRNDRRIGRVRTAVPVDALVDHAHEIAVAEEGPPRDDHSGGGVDAAGDLDAVSDTSADGHLRLHDLGSRSRRVSRS